MPQATRPTCFNPDGQPNCTPEGYDVKQANPVALYPSSLTPSLTNSRTRARFGPWEDSYVTS